MHFIEKLFWWNVFSMGEHLCVYKGITLSLNWIHDFKRYYQNRFGLNFPIASRSILSAASTINNTRRRCKTFMIGQLLFLGGVISTRLCNARAEGFFSEQFIFPQYGVIIDYPLQCMFIINSCKTLSLSPSLSVNGR